MHFTTVFDASQHGYATSCWLMLEESVALGVMQVLKKDVITPETADATAAETLAFFKAKRGKNGR